MSQRIPVIAIDGPGASGKGVVSHHLAQRYGYHLLDSGALYRLVGLRARQAGLFRDWGKQTARRGYLYGRPNTMQKMARLAKGMDFRFQPTGDPEGPLAVFLDGREVTSRLRSDQAGTDASTLAALPAVRKALYGLQQSLRKPPGLVADGRDMGTVVFPDADAKIYLTATAEARAQRRHSQLKNRAEGASLHSLLQSIQARDERDRTRKASPLYPAEDALQIDSTHLDMAEVLAQVDAFVAEKLGGSHQ